VTARKAKAKADSQGNDSKKGKGKGKDRSRFPAGMTERKAKAVLGAKAPFCLWSVRPEAEASGYLTPGCKRRTYGTGEPVPFSKPDLCNDANQAIM
jgi:hypothetical protein